MSGDRLRKFRHKAGLDQSDVADELGVHQPRVSRWENDRDDIPDKYIPHLADLFGVDESELQDEPEPDRPDDTEPTPGKTVRTSADVNRWLREVARDEDLTFEVQAILVRLTAFQDDEEDWPLVVVTPDELKAQKTLPDDIVEEHWEDVLESRWVERKKGLDHVLRLVFPDEK